MKLKSFPFHTQADSMDCGPTCLRMIAKYYGRPLSLQSLREKTNIDKQGVNLLGISAAAEEIGFRTMAVKIPVEDSKHGSLLKSPLPCILHWNQNHFVVLYKINRKAVWLADPATGRIKIKREIFEKSWLTDNNKGVALLLETTPQFLNSFEDSKNKVGIRYLFQYLIPYKKFYLQLILGMLLGIAFQLIFPFLTQSVVDYGIQNQDVNFIALILVAQVILYTSQLSVQFIQSWIILHISTRINVSILSDFLYKLMKLPLAFFDSKNVGDLLQRIGDHKRIEALLTSSSLNVIFSFISLLVFGAVLLFYNLQIFIVFTSGAIAYIIWIFLFLKKRKEIDYLAFQELADNQGALIEIIHGMSEIKLQNSEVKRRTNWTNIQARLFSAQMKSLSITQYQDVGGNFIGQIKDISISFLAATAVIEGQITLGMMMAIQYIIGQLNAPLNQLISFVRTAQDAKISLERLSEIHLQKDESDTGIDKVPYIPQGDIELKNVSFRYSKTGEYVLRNLNLSIPRGKTTAIVGESGSGKTTLIKLLLGFYSVAEGRILIGHQDFSHVDQSIWRKNCGAVLQDGYIFSDTIAKNIAESDDGVDRKKLLKSVQTSNIQPFIESLPLQYNTMIGSRGNGLSQGQKQRILMARAVYKDPSILFFDEATNALDANNEMIIMKNLHKFLLGRTVVVVAHRLSTVKHADQIVVLENGEIKERGNHQSLVQKKGKYFQLIKNQLELGN